MSLKYEPAQVVALGPQEETSPVQRGEQADVAALLRLLLPDTVDLPDDAAPSPRSARQAKAGIGVLALYESASAPALDPRFVLPAGGRHSRAPRETMVRQFRSRAPRETIGSERTAPLLVNRGAIGSWFLAQELPLHANVAEALARSWSRSPAGSRAQDNIGGVHDLPLHSSVADDLATQRVAEALAALGRSWSRGSSLRLEDEPQESREQESVQDPPLHQNAAPIPLRPNDARVGSDGGRRDWSHVADALARSWSYTIHPKP